MNTDDKDRELIAALNKAEAEADALAHPSGGMRGMSTLSSRTEARRRLRDVLLPRIALLKRQIKANDRRGTVR